MCPSMSFEIKSVVEAFATEGAQVSLDITMAFHMPVEQPLKTKHLGADPTNKTVSIIVARHIVGGGVSIEA